MTATQRSRVLAAARRFNGVCAVDFQLPDVCDGGPPILRVAARLYELDQEGYVFEFIGKRSKCKVFRLISEPEEVEGGARGEKTGEKAGERDRLALDKGGPSNHAQAAAPGTPSPALSLFDGMERRKGQLGYGEEERAA